MEGSGVEKINILKKDTDIAGGVINEEGMAVKNRQERIRSIKNKQINLGTRNIKNEIKEEDIFSQKIQEIINNIALRQDVKKGIDSANKIIQEKGWQYFLDNILAVGRINKKNDLFDNTFIAVRECVHTLGNPAELPINSLEKILEYTSNDIEWLSIKAIIANRQKIENLTEFNDEEVLLISEEESIPFWDEEKTVEEVKKIFKNNGQARNNLLNILGKHLQFTDKTRQLNIWREMDDDKFLREIYPAFVFGVVEKYRTTKEIKQRLILSREELREKVKEEIQKNITTFKKIMWYQSNKNKQDYFVNKYFNKYNLVSVLVTMSQKVGVDDIEDSFGFAINSTAIPVARDAIAIYNPNGEFILMFDSSVKMKKEYKNASELVEMANFLSFKNKLLQRQYSEKTIALLTAIFYWRYIPEIVQEGVLNSFEKVGISSEEIKNLFDFCEDKYFETAIDTVSQYANVISVNVVRDLYDFVNAEMQKYENSTKVKFIGAKEYLNSVDAEHGKTKISVEELRHEMTVLNFDTVKYLEEQLDFNLEKLSRKEFFSLITYLRMQNNGKGFKNLHEFIGEQDEAVKLNRIRVFISLVHHEVEIGDKILIIGHWEDQEAANKVFAKYTEIVDVVGKIREEIKSYTKTSIVDEDLGAIEQEMLLNANNILTDSANLTPKSKEDFQRVMIDLEKIKADLVGTLAIYKVLNGQIDIEELNLVEKEIISIEDFNNGQDIIEKSKIKFLEKYNATEDVVIEDIGNLNERQQEKINVLIDSLNIQKRNWRDKKNRGRQILTETLDKLKNGKAELITYLHNGTAMATMLIERVGDEEVVLSFFNSAKSVKGRAVGGALLTKVLKTFANKKKVTAETTKIKEALPVYLNRFNFVGVGSNLVRGNLSMRIQADTKTKYFYKGYSAQEIKKEFEIQKNKTKGNHLIISMDLNNHQQNNEALSNLLKTDYICTKVVIDQIDNLGYFAMERVAQT